MVWCLIPITLLVMAQCVRACEGFCVALLIVAKRNAMLSASSPVCLLFAYSWGNFVLELSTSKLCRAGLGLEKCRNSHAECFRTA